MITNLKKFIRNLAGHTIPLHNLHKKDVFFEIQKPQLDTTETRNLKILVTSAPCLKIFDSKLPTHLKSDDKADKFSRIKRFSWRKIWNRR